MPEIHDSPTGTDERIAAIREREALQQFVDAYRMALASTPGDERPSILAMKAAYYAALDALASAQAAQPSTCEWREYSDTSVYATACGHVCRPSGSWTWKFCPYCAGKLTVAPLPEAPRQ